jgi:diphthamide synthase (EF-2-diphthine--ammonia ligase)
MFQTVGVEIVDGIAKCLEVSLIKQPIGGKSVNQGLYYDAATVQ